MDALVDSQGHRAAGGWAGPYPDHLLPQYKSKLTERYGAALDSGLRRTLQGGVGEFVKVKTVAQPDVTALREVLLAMDSETRALRAILPSKADKKEVVFRHEMDEWIDRRCKALLAPVVADLATYKAHTNDRIARLEEDLGVTRGKLADAQEVIAKHTTKIGNLASRLLKAEAALIDKAEQSELDAFVQVTNQYMGRTDKHLSDHDHQLQAARQSLEAVRQQLQAQVSANLEELRTIPPTVPDLDEFHNWVAKNKALDARQLKLFEQMNLLKKAYYASDASLPLKTQLELFMGEDGVPR
jgi:hypothetical protein